MQKEYDKTNVCQDNQIIEVVLKKQLFNKQMLEIHF